MNFETKENTQVDLTKELDFREVDHVKALKSLKEYIDSLDAKEQDIYTNTKKTINKYDEKGL